MSINFVEAEKKIKKVQEILSKLDHVVTKYLNPIIYSNGNRTIELTSDMKDDLASEYDEIKDELKAKVEELPGGDE